MQKIKYEKTKRKIMEIKIIDLSEISIPFDFKIEDKEVTHAVIQGTIGTGISSYASVLDSYIKKNNITGEKK